MKVICLILAACTILLSTRPCCSDNDCRGGLTENKEKSDKLPSKEKECPLCSPFFSCCSGTGVIISKPIDISWTGVVEIGKEHNSVYKQPRIKKVALSIWLPPEIS